MHILRIADVPNNRTGGMSRAMYGSGDALQAMGHQVDYLFSEDLQTGGAAKLRRFTVPLRLPGLIREMARAGKTYDVVEIHEPLAAPSCYARKRKSGLPPVVIFSHGLEERGRMLEFAYKQQKGLPISLKQRVFPMTVILQAMYSVRNADHVLCCNQQDLEHLRAAGVPAHRLTRHFNAVETPFLEAGEAISRTETQAASILFLSTWLPRKGTLDLVPAISQVLRQNPSARFTAAGVGFAKEHVLGDFAPELHSRIQVIPKIASNQELIEVYRQHGIFVLPSFAEGQPLVMFEAAAMGMAIVTTNVAGMPDFIDHEQNGLLLPVGAPEILAQKLSELLNAPWRAGQLGKAAQEKAKTHTWLHSAHNIAAAYKKALAV